jgi:hypothetical protein
MIRTGLLRRGAVTAGAALLVLTVSTGVASASKVPKETNTSFAGYQISKPTTHIKSASASFVVPTITCKKNSSGVGPALVVQSTVNKKNIFTQSGAGVGAGCQHHVAEYQSIIVVDSSSSNDLTLTPGDRISVSLSMNKSKTKVTFDDLTSKQTKTRVGKGSIGATGLVGASSLEINGVGVGLDPFTKFSATGVEFNGKPLASEKPTQLTWVRGHGKKQKTLVAPGAITKKKDFSLTFKNS